MTLTNEEITFTVEPAEEDPKNYVIISVSNNVNTVATFLVTIKELKNLDAAVTMHLDMIEREDEEE